MKRNNINNTPKIILAASTPKNISVENKSEIVLIPSNISKMTDDEIKLMQDRVTMENERIMKKYYSIDSSIKKIRQRSFLDLVKKFFEKSNDAITFYDLVSMVRVRR